MDIISYVKNIFQVEVDEINRVKDRIGKEVEECIKLILETKGKVVITGVGKSGHIGKKNGCYFCFYRDFNYIYAFYRGSSWRFGNDTRR
jgi:Predicted sugar phosphate isomerase involved in capsule formation